MHLRLLTAVSLVFVLAPEGEAQRTRTPRKKPFQEFSESAQRLKDSVAVRVIGRGTPDAPFTIPAWDDAETRDSLVSMARSQIGARYILGAQTPGKAFDCSGLVRFVMAALRIDLPRTAHEQAQRGAVVSKNLDELRVGDLLTFGLGKRVTHIGIYIGEGRFVHASVAARKVVESRIDKPGNWYSRHWMGTRRLLAATIAVDSLAIQ
jgi:cell wall-associated NlpC family hydrolase